MKYLIKWRNRSASLWRKAGQVITGVSRYDTQEQAEKQAAIFASHFPANTYYIEPTAA